MHFVVGLAEQAEASLKVWEELLSGDECVGASALGGGRIGRKSGMMRLLRTLCRQCKIVGVKSPASLSFFANSFWDACCISGPFQEKQI